MRRAAAVVLGTLTGTALLVGAKYGNASADSDTGSGASGVVVAVGDGTPPATAPAPGKTAGGGATTGAPAPPGTRTGPTTSRTTPGATATPTRTSGGGTTPTPTPTKTTAPGLYKNGSYQASAPVQGGDQGTLSMTVTVSGGRITAISASESNPSEPSCYHNSCPTLISEALSAQNASVASVSHATHTSTAFKSALGAILSGPAKV
jgi:uncharacterized protein with FMN-binding domain